MSDNQIEGGDLSKLIALYPNLNVLKIANNKIASLDEVKVLAGLKDLKILDLQDNPVTSKDDYRDTVYKTIESLEVLDGKYKSGDVYESESEDEFLFDEEGEADLEEQDKILEQLDEETKKRLEEGKMTAEEMEALGLRADLFMNEEYGEEEQEEAEDD